MEIIREKAEQGVAKYQYLREEPALQEAGFKQDLQDARYKNSILQINRTSFRVALKCFLLLVKKLLLSNLEQVSKACEGEKQEHFHIVQGSDQLD